MEKRARDGVSSGRSSCCSSSLAAGGAAAAEAGLSTSYVVVVLVPDVVSAMAFLIGGGAGLGGTYWRAGQYCRQAEEGEIPCFPNPRGCRRW